MKLYRNTDTMISLFLVTLGTFIFSFGINAIVISNHFGEGGVTGLTLLLYYLFGISPAMSNLILNSVLLVIGYQFLERKTMFYTVLAVIEISFFLNLTKNWYQFTPDNIVIAAVGGGTILGIALGIVMLGNGTTAGTDILAMMMKKYLGWNVAFSLLLLDVCIVTPLSFIIGLEKAIVTLLMLVIASRMINFMLEGFNPKKSVMIISRHYEEIGQAIQEKIGRGTTVFDGHGFYSKEERKVLYVIVNRMQLMALQRIVHDMDPQAFVIITDVNQVFGEGFTFHLDHRKESMKKNNKRVV